jgi:hypothetical protein
MQVEASLSGFAATHANLKYIKNHNILLRDDENFHKDENSVVVISGGELNYFYY